MRRARSARRRDVALLHPAPRRPAASRTPPRRASGRVAAERTLIIFGHGADARSVLGCLGPHTQRSRGGLAFGPSTCAHHASETPALAHRARQDRPEGAAARAEARERAAAARDARRDRGAVACDAQARLREHDRGGPRADRRVGQARLGRRRRARARPAGRPLRAPRPHARVDGRRVARRGARRFDRENEREGTERERACACARARVHTPRERRAREPPPRVRPPRARSFG